MHCMVCGQPGMAHVDLPFYVTDIERNGAIHQVILPRVSGDQCPTCLGVLMDADTTGRLFQALQDELWGCDT